MRDWGTQGRALAVGAVLLAACSNGSADAPLTTAEATTTEPTTTTTTAPERPVSTTTTAFDPASVEGQVEAAYLKSWDVYADAVYNLELDEHALAEVYADPLLSARRKELELRIAEGRASAVLVEHDYQIEFTGPETAVVLDAYLNHQVLIDPETRAPIEPDPNDTLVDAFTAKRI
ncbi:MAG: hypothetical protein ABWZ76_11630, partial [Acidimicrobiales bacterium]